MTRIALLACAAAFAVAGCSTTGGDGVASASAKDWSAPVGEDGRVPFASTYAPYPGRPTALTGATIYDGRGGMIENGTVLIRGDRIVAVGPAGSVEIPRGATTVDMAGKVIMPGLVDAHAHGPQGQGDLIPQQNWAQVQQLALGQAAELASCGVIHFKAK